MFSKQVSLVLPIAAVCVFAWTPAAFAQVGPNDVALGKSAFQSSDYDANHTASKAVDGNVDGSFFDNSMSTTNNDPFAYWYVDLGADYSISSITLWNRN